MVGDRLVVVAVGKPVGTEERGAGTRLARKFDCKTLVAVGRYLLQVRRSTVRSEICVRLGNFWSFMEIFRIIFGKNMKRA